MKAVDAELQPAVPIQVGGPALTGFNTPWLGGFLDGYAADASPANRPDVISPRAAWQQLLAPGEQCPLEPAACRVLPLGPARQARAGPGAAGLGVTGGDTQHGWLCRVPASEPGRPAPATRRRRRRTTSRPPRPARAGCRVGYHRVEDEQPMCSASVTCPVALTNVANCWLVTVVADPVGLDRHAPDRAFAWVRQRALVSPEELTPGDVDQSARGTLPERPEQPPARMGSGSQWPGTEQLLMTSASPTTQRGSQQSERSWLQLLQLVAGRGRGSQEKRVSVDVVTRPHVVQWKTWVGSPSHVCSLRASPASS